ncbi:MAG: hypothetical protein U1F71_05675 [Verrucomicrobiaceae bacterium]
MTTAPTQASASRSSLVTVIGWIIIIGGALFSIISFFSFLMIMVGKDGARNTELVGFLLVVVAPPVTAFAGLGLIKRWRWAWYYLLLGLVAVTIGNAVVIVRDPGPSVTTSTSPTGTKTTTYHSGAGYLLPVVALSAGMLVVLLLPPFRREFATAHRQAPPLPASPDSSAPAPTADQSARGWRAGHRGRDCMFYEEKIDGTWQRIVISGEMLMGRAHHVIYFPPPEAWARLPEWARHRREEIIARIKSEFREPDYEYASDVMPSASLTAAPVVSSRTPAAERWTGQQWMAVVTFVAILLGVAVFTGWKVKAGLEKGIVTLPIPKASLQRPVLRDEEPALFWFSLSVYAVAGLGSLGVLVRMVAPTGKALKR